MKDKSLEGKRRDIVKQLFKLEGVVIQKIGYVCPVSWCTFTQNTKFDIYDHYYEKHLERHLRFDD